MHPLDRLSARQQELLHTWFPDAVVEHDHSWGLVPTRVLQIAWGTERFIVKAADPSDRHLDRELRAHRQWLAPWRSRGLAPELVYADPAARLLVTRYLPGELVQGHPAADEPDTYRQAGRVLALLHAQPATVVADHEPRENAAILAWLDKPHGIEPSTARRLQAEIASWPTPPSTLVPTHGDWQPRNWLIDAGVVRVIDFGRAALRPAMTDLARLATQDFARDPHLASAFFEGYGPDPREPRAWRRVQVRQAIGTAVWAHQVGDADFEAHGLRLIDALLRTAG